MTMWQKGEGPFRLYDPNESLPEWTRPEQPLYAALDAILFMLAARKAVRKTDIRRVIQVAKNKAVILEAKQMLQGLSADEQAAGATSGAEVHDPSPGV